jgi:homoaconitase
MIVARSFARIHETNLKVYPCPHFSSLPPLSDPPPSPSHQGCSLTFQKQGILPLWFTDKSDYSLISAHDKVTTSGLSSLLQNGSGEIVLQVTRPSGEKIEIKTSHTMSKDQLEWLRAGSALNYIGEQARVAGRA